MIQNTKRSHLTARWLVIVNPQANNGNLEQWWPTIQTKLQALIPDTKIVMSKHSGNATQLVEEAVSEGIRHIMAVGGDGIAHQVINGIVLQKKTPSREITFALLPLGTGNDWIKSHGISKKWSSWKQYFLTAVPAYQNLGKINYQSTDGSSVRYFMNVAGLAYDAFVVRYMMDKKSRLPGKVFYFWATFRCLFMYKPQGGIIKYDEHQHEAAYYTINAGIGRFSGGGMQLVPQARSQGETMALTYVKKVSKLAVVLNSFRFYQGRIAGYKKAYLTNCKTIEVIPRTGDELLIEADGEFLGACPATISLLPNALRFLSPNKANN
jgi:YegS/Rv2252/BmrU family lipid kinase